MLHTNPLTEINTEINTDPLTLVKLLHLIKIEIHLATSQCAEPSFISNLCGTQTGTRLEFIAR